MPNFFTSLALWASALSAVVAAPTNSRRANVEALQALIGQTIPDKYIVVYKSDVSADARAAHQASVAELHKNRLARREDSSLNGIEREYSKLGNFGGYAGSFDSATIESIKASDEVAYVEQDQYAVPFEIITQEDVPSWGLARVSQASTDPDLTTYYYDSTAGSGATAYVIDTGVHITHETFEGRASWGANFADNSDDDGYGHGTHVAGTIAGAEYGLAKEASIIAVKVLDDSGSGTYAAVISGIEWAADDAASKGTSDSSVANMSLGGSKSQAVNDAVAAAVASGVFFGVAAGNSNTNAATFSPASEPTAFTVGATTSTDARASYSNYGALVDVFAPGTSITSAWTGSDTAEDTISGTSMATPHVVGVAAYFIGLGVTGSDAITAEILSLAVDGVVTNPGTGTTDSLLYNGAA